MLDFSDAGQEPALTIDPDMIKTYLLALFGDQDEGWVEFRGIHDKDKKSIAPRTECAHLANLSDVVHMAAELAYQWGKQGRALFVCPAVLKERGKATLDNLSHFTTVVVDLDSGDTVAKRDKLQSVLGLPRMVVHSGGTTKTGHPKQHVYWALSEAEDDITRVTILRGRMARYVGDDESFGRRATQIIRVAGSLHQKGEPKLVELVERSTSGVHHLMDLEERLPHSVAPNSPGPGMMDFSQAGPAGQDATRRELQGMTVEAGGQGVATRYDAFTKVAGGIIRDNDQDLPLAFEMVSAWVSAKMSPPWDEKRMRQEFGALARKHGENYPDGANPEIEWCPEAKDPREIQALPEMPIDMLPEQLRDWIVDSARGASVPIEMVAVPAMAAIGLLLSGKVSTLPDPYNLKWVIYPNLWCVVVAPPGSRKTGAIHAALGPLRALDRARQKQRKLAQEREDRLIKLRTMASKSADQPAGDDSVESIADDMGRGLISEELAEQRLAELEERQRAVKVKRAPPIHTYMAGDINSAALGTRCQTGPVMIYRDELSALLNTFGDEGNTIRQLLLEGHSGENDAIVDRVGRGHLHIQNVRAGVCGGIQSGPWSAFVTQAKGVADGSRMGGGGGADGFMQRFSLTVLSGKTGSPVKHRSNPLHEERVVQLLTRIDQATEFQAQQLYVYNENVNGVTRIPFSAEADKVMTEWVQANMRDYVANQDIPEYKRSHYGKYDKLVAGLALIFHTLECAAGYMMPEVKARNVELAIRWADYMRLHAEEMYRDHAPAKLLDKIAHGFVVDGMHTTEVYRMGGTGLRTANDLNEAVAQMPGLMHITRRSGGKGGRAQMILRLHPNIQEILS